jgi:hypothetical protein
MTDHDAHGPQQSDDTLRYIEEIRAAFDTLWDRFTIEDFRRVHAKFFGAIVSVEIGFQRRFPEAWQAYEHEFYGDDSQQKGHQ